MHRLLRLPTSETHRHSCALPSCLSPRECGFPSCLKKGKGSMNVTRVHLVVSTGQPSLFLSTYSTHSIGPIKVSNAMAEVIADDCYLRVYEGEGYFRPHTTGWSWYKESTLHSIRHIPKLSEIITQYILERQKKEVPIVDSTV